MVEPSGADEDRLVKQVGRAMVKVAGAHWQRIRAEYRAAGRHVEVDVLVTGADGVPVLVRPPVEVVEGLARLRELMHSPTRGTWLWAVYEIEPPGAFTCDWYPNDEPRWRRVPPPIGFQDELRTFPRAEEHIPDWLRLRAGLPPRDAPPLGAPLPGAPVPHPAGTAVPQPPGASGPHHTPGAPHGFRPGAPAPQWPGPTQGAPSFRPGTPGYPAAPQPPNHGSAHATPPQGTRTSGPHQTPPPAQPWHQPGTTGPRPQPPQGSPPPQH
ncbi:hypothetical protein [Actinokineospora bangkokensis]|uniref:Uncharacterized protein n=1 Tax=Actinokineospora bangkokensis TaxID=1193682 RepID=A0A1Q9LSH5_9PSEU|nr:hypothetical protein [Actinokineospora bangkokensis]OLR94951.1 hypothetical protein BJP25_08230 [Actinokineospora bangkokensis]